MSAAPSALLTGDGSRFEKGLVLATLGGLALLPWVLDTHALALASVLPASLLVIDFLSGVLHWAFDHHVRPESRWLGPFVADFLDHHESPLRTLEVGFFKSAFRSTAWIALPTAALAVLLRDRPYLTALLYSLAVLSIVAPQFHKLAHAPAPSAPVRALQRSGLILGRRAHAKHHRSPHDCAFCIATGWCNPLLDALGFWRGLDASIRWLRARATRAPE